MTKFLHIKQHLRRSPRDPYADIREAKTRQLREEVDAHLTRVCVFALEEVFSEGELTVLRETW
ncbi:hypothetical protein [Chelativorans xinjiangense]|uniref:hypothetical protein n=1 Tax=Chelativorans xinjiangense TaxID=2681485 RepID=UPI00135B1BB1|nr:hypothetical protein [Chelativorans xinjiangense]